MELLTPKTEFAAKLETIRRQLTSAEWIADAFEVLNPWLATLPNAEEIGLKLEHSPEYPGEQVQQLKLDRD